MRAGQWTFQRKTYRRHAIVCSGEMSTGTEPGKRGFCASPGLQNSEECRQQRGCEERAFDNAHTLISTSSTSPVFCSPATPPLRITAVAIAMLLLLLAAPRCEAQWYTGWYGGWSGEGSTPWSSAVKAQANLVAAEGQAAESYARAAESAEHARAQYLENQARYVEWRQQQRWITEERRAARHAALKAKAAGRPAPRPPTDLYPPLAPDQLDRLTGEIHWPGGLMDPEYAKDRAIVESALRTRAETGPDERTSSILHDAAWRMLAHSAPSMRQLDSQEHLACRRFLKSLMLEGEFSPGVLR